MSESEKPSTTFRSPGRSGTGTESIRGHLAKEAGNDVRVATGDSSDPDLAPIISAMLAAVKETLKMDVAFVSEFVGGRRVFRRVIAPEGNPVIAEGASDPLEESWCFRVAEGRLPTFIANVGELRAQGVVEEPSFPIGTHLSVPIVTTEGHALGTVCCFSFAPNALACMEDLGMLQALADFLAVSGKRW